MNVKVEFRARRDKEDEMRRLEKKYGKKKGREMAESQYKNFLERHQQEEYEEVQRQQEVSIEEFYKMLLCYPT